MQIAIGIGLGWPGTYGIAAGASIALSASTIPEDASLTDVIGTFSIINGSGGYLLTITADPDDVFDLDGADLIVDGALDYETATSHSVTVQADNGVDTPISRVFSIAVTDVSEGGGSFALIFSDPTNSMYIGQVV